MFKASIFLALILGFASSANCFNPNDRLLKFYVVSDTSDWASGPDQLAGGAAVLTVGNAGWTVDLPGANWIWDSINVSDPSASQVVHFVKEFYIPGAPVSGSYQANGDNQIWSSINGVSISACDSVNSYTAGSTKTCDVTPYLIPGMNILQIKVQNYGNAGQLPGPGVNPAGALYKLTLVARVDGH